MPKSSANRDAYLDSMCAFVLEHGFGEASLRPLAKAAGTSDRMLIYHFGNKQRMMNAILERLAANFTAGLDAILPETAHASRRALLEQVLQVVRAPEVAAYVRVWQEMTALAAQGDAAHVETGQVIVQGFVDWLERRMPEDDPNPGAAAGAMLTVIEGVHVMDAVGRDDLVDVAVDVLFPK